jgi:hypothetical protein
MAISAPIVCRFHMSIFILEPTPKSSLTPSVTILFRKASPKSDGSASILCQPVFFGSKQLSSLGVDDVH